MPIFEAALHEKQKTDSQDTMGILWRPNNYRRKAGLPVGKIISDTTLVSLGGWYRDVKITKKKVAMIGDYPGLKLIVGRRSVTGIWAQEMRGSQKVVFSLHGSSVEMIQGLLNEKKESIRASIDLALLDFLDRLGMASGVVPIWERSEDWIRDTGYKVPLGSVVYLDGAKKVYEEGVEFTTGSGEEPLVGLSAFLENRSLEKVAPQVAAEIAALRRELARHNEILSKATILIPEKSASKLGQKRLNRWFDG